MKTLGLFLSITLATSMSMAADICAEQAESYVTNAGYTSPAVLTAETAEGQLVYQVRTNQNGGEAAFEVIVDSACRLLSIKTLWAE